MSDYIYADDGKLHTRYSELVRCTPGQIKRVLDERAGRVNRFEGEAMKWGTSRHEMWQEEAEKTGKLPACFGGIHPTVDLDFVEKEFATEILPGIVLHSRMDAVALTHRTIFDFKTLVAGSFVEGVGLAFKMYEKSVQLPVYAYQIGLHNHRIVRLVYLVEIWNRERTTILGYQAVEKTIKVADIAKIVPWIHGRASLLSAALEAEQ